MKKLITALAFGLTLLTQTAWANPPIIWGSTAGAQLLTGGLDFNSAAQILVGTLDPSSVAVNAPKGSIYIRSGSSGGTMFQKQDNGSTTNWNSFPSGSGTGVITLNGLGGSTQSFATGSSGTDFGISSSGTTHTFNIPSASSLNRGLVTTGSQTFAGAKTFSSTIVGSVSGNSGTATIFDHTPTACADGNHFANSIDSGGNFTCTTIPNAATTATNGNTPSAIVARDGSGNFSAGTVTANLTGGVTGNVTGNVTGALTGNADTATNSTNASHVGTVASSSNASYFPLFAASSTNGNQVPNLGTGLSFNPSTNVLSTTTFSGDLSGNAATSTSATTATNATNASTVAASSNASYFPLFAASSTNSNQAFNLGTGLSFNPSTNVLTTTTFSGALSGNSTTATTATNATNVTTTSTSSNASFYPLFVGSSSNGNQSSDLNSGFSYNPSTHNLSTTTFTGDLVGNAATSTSATTATSATSATNATNTTNVGTTQVSNSASYFPLMVSSSTNGNQAADLGTGLTFNPSTNNLSTTTFTGALSGNATNVTGTVAIGNGGTGATAKQAAFDALSPGSAAGDIILHNGTHNVAQAVGTDGYRLTANSGVANKVSYTRPDGLYEEGINLLLNGSWEYGTTSWTASAGTYTQNTAAANLIPPGVGSASWATASTRTLSSSLITVNANDGLSGANIAASCAIKGGTGGIAHTLEIVDGSANVLASTTITSSASGFQRGTVNAVAPASGSIGIVILGGGTETIYIDQCFLGRAESFNLGQGIIVTDWAAYTPTFTGFGTVSTQTFYWRRVGDSMEITGHFVVGTSTAVAAQISLPSGYSLNTAKMSATQDDIFGWLQRSANATTSFPVTTLGPWAVTSATGTSTTSVFLSIQSANGSTFALSNGSAISSSGDHLSVHFTVPISSWTSVATLYRPDQTPASWSGTQVGAGGGWSTTSASYANLSVATTSNTVTQVNARNMTCVKESTKLPGITCTPPRTGMFFACVSGSGKNATTTGNNAFFRLVDSTGTVINGGQIFDATAGNFNTFSMCGIYNVVAAADFTIELQAEGNGSDTISVIQSSGAPLTWTIVELDAPMPAPYLQGGMTSGSSGAEISYRANMTCSSSSAVNHQDGTGFTSIGNIASGKCTVTIPAADFSSTAYDCNVTVNGTAVASITSANINNKSSTAFDLYFALVSSGSSTIAAATSVTFDIACRGPK